MDCTRRLAIVFRIWVRGTSRYDGTTEGRKDATSVARAAVPATACPTASRSRRITRPSGPDPLTTARSTPRSAAIFRARGEALMRVERRSGGRADGGGGGAPVTI